jgi:excinuclease ABC subunit A
MASADWLVELGPEGGDAGGRIVAEGTPEQIAANPASHTGHYLKSALEAINGVRSTLRRLPATASSRR